MQFIVAESTGSAVANFLRGIGHDVLVVAETMPQAEDADILARATAEARIVVTNDKDFGDPGSVAALRSAVAQSLRGGQRKLRSNSITVRRTGG